MLLLVALTILTQIGGVVYVLGLLAWRTLAVKMAALKILIFAVLYLVATFLIVPPLAAYWGRTPVTHEAGIRPATLLTIFLNRNYVRTEVNTTLRQSARQLKDYGIELI